MKKPPPNVADVLEKTGATYRMIDYWVRIGLLHPGNPLPGSGAQREWSAQELRVAKRMVELIRCGLTVHAAHHAARNGGELLTGDFRVAKRRKKAA
jgi:DNA-binding transcriptional MerR regulator